MYVAGIDPGREKCGVALLDISGNRLGRAVVDKAELAALLKKWSGEYGPLTLVIGNGTGHDRIKKLVESAPWFTRLENVITVDERFTTLEARRRYFSENPPRGLKRLVPTTMQLPPKPYDDYVAIILAERYIATLS